jgi:NADPH:quinone reductase-like Zn-dependent oxidoreductase
MAVSPPAWLYFLFTFAIFVITRFSRRDAYRKARIPPNLERVLVLGASSGIGKQIAIQYAARGARLAIVGRREKELDEAKRECVIGDEDEKRVISIPADFTVVDDMFRLVKTLERGEPGLSIPC